MLSPDDLLTLRQRLSLSDQAVAVIDDVRSSDQHAESVAAAAT